MVLATLTRAQLFWAEMADRPRRRRGDESGIEQVALLLIILGIAVVVTVAILVAVRSSLWSTTDSSLDQVDNAVTGFNGGTRP